ncbi:MAG: hypothetical protein CVU77_05810 [Elusimicrobia bacterium HGW-Elusimicrobia-1]|jgi:undecaprenyl-diphosphatase|nr:MAG: hypothetical protein CVU77_05810 [Elusimicrobia bacterium HGW-Elusimicrobia-1]
MISNILEILGGWDTALFRILNGSLTCGFMDALMPFVTNTKNFYPAFILLFAGLMIFGKYRGRIAGITVVMGTSIADVISSRILKELFARPRPFVTLEDVRQLVGAAGFSMPSSHAFNSFAAATMFALFFDKKLPDIKNPAERFAREKWAAIVAYFLAFLSAYSRIYVGVHYPADSLVGAAGGMLTGWLSYKAAKAVAVRAGRPLD